LVLGNVGTLITARGFAYAFNIATPVLLARRLPTEQFGTYREVLLLGFTVASLLELGLPQSLYYFLPTNNPLRGRVVTQSLGVLVALAGVVFVVFAAGGPLAGKVFQLSDAGLLSPLVAAYVSGTLLTSILETILLAQGRVKSAALTTFGTEFARSSLILCVVLVAPGIEGLLVALVSAVGVRLLLLFRVAWPYFRGGALWDAAVARAQFRFCGPFALSRWVATASGSLDKYLIALTAGPTAFAIYSVGLMGVPFMDILFVSHSDVALPRMQRYREAGHVEEIVKLWREIAIQLSSFVVPTLGLCFALASDGFVSLYGEQYAESAGVFQIFLLGLVPLYAVPYGLIVRVYGNTRLVFQSNLLALMVTAPSLWALWHLFGLRGVAAASAIGAYATTLPQIIAGARLLNVSLGELIPTSRLARLVVCAFAAGAAALLVRYSLNVTHAPGLVIVLGVYGTTYLVAGTSLRVIPWTSAYLRVRSALVGASEV
jgi:O-antigen/teichoic acid export membrane protein